MIYNFANEFDIQKHDIHIERAKRLKKKVRSETISEKRSLSINAYLHVLIQYFACEYGETTKYVKQKLYKDINRDIYYIEYKNKKQGYSRDELRSSADLTDKEMALSIERFKDYAAKEAGIFLPPADNKEFLAHCMNEIEKHKQYI
jgi:hypothetical protein